ncbi:MAG TPA: heavy-metal-associated domain-containing protein [Thermodesulfatator atlanticus]|uniref:Heavy-metal-associated domain-containing protein n=1 Tax=Thermodesulfatator atlanticus TaxID=501497 RepID=A0A7V5NZP0_9BACT|nr:heavy-metal-associated domain-containing protein [Thermodesulfatator atlanticus]
MRRIKIAGMSCEHCVKRVTKALESLPGVTNVKVSLSTGEATFEAPPELSLEEVAKVIAEAGYQVVRE